jgi:hypothetical protein
VQLLLCGGMTYSIVASAATGTDRAKEHHSSVAVYWPLLSKSFCIVAYFTVVA